MPGSTCNTYTVQTHLFSSFIMRTFMKRHIYSNSAFNSFIISNSFKGAVEYIDHTQSTITQYVNLIILVTKKIENLQILCNCIALPAGHRHWPALAFQLVGIHQDISQPLYAPQHKAYNDVRTFKMAITALNKHYLLDRLCILITEIS